MLTPLRHRNFALLWWAGLISIAGDWTLRVALPIYVLKVTGSPAAVAGVVVASVLPVLLVGLVAGVYVDRWDRRRVMIVTNILQGLALVPLVAVDSPSKIWIVYPVAFAESTLAQFFAPAENALLPRLVDTAQLTTANSLNTLNNNIARLVGPAVGGAAAAALGLTGVALLDAASFLVAAGLIALIRGRYVAQGVTERRHLLHELRDGLVAAARSRVTLAIMLVIGIGSIGEGIMGSTFPVFVQRALHGDAPELGYLMSAQAVGGIAGGLLGAAFGRRVTNPARLVTATLLAFGLVDLVIFNYPRWATALWPEVVLFVIVGVPAAVGNAALMSLFQSEIADALLGRVFAAVLAVESVANMAGAGLAAAFTDRLGVVNILTVQGLGYVVGGVLFGALVLGARARLVPVKAPPGLATQVAGGDHPLE